MRKIKAFITSLTEKARKEFDIRDVFIFGGLSLMGYGLFLLRPWLGWSVTGLFLMAIGFLSGRGVKL